MRGRADAPGGAELAYRRDRGNGDAPRAAVPGELGSAMAAARIERGLSTRTLAGALTEAGYPVSHQRVSDYERGTLPTECYVATLEQVLHLDEGVLVDRWCEARRGRLQRRRGPHATVAEPGDAPKRAEPPARGRVRRTSAVATLAVFGALSALAFVLITGTRGTEEAESRAGAATTGEPLDGSGGDPGAACVPVGHGDPAYGPSFVQAYEEAGGRSALGCAVSKIHVWGPGQIQDLRGGELGRGAIMALDPDHVVVVAGEAWHAYHDAIGPGGSGVFAGYPVTVDEPCRGGLLVQLAGGSGGSGGLVRRDDNGRWLWVYGPIWAEYLERGGPQGELGLPARTARATVDAVQQRFDGGDIVVAAADVSAASTSAPPVPAPIC